MNTGIWTKKLIMLSRKEKIKGRDIVSTFYFLVKRRFDIKFGSPKGSFLNFLKTKLRNNLIKRQIN